MNGWLCPGCGSTKVTIVADVLVCLGCGLHNYLYDYRNAYDNPLTLGITHPDISELEDRISNLESITAERGSIPRRYHEEFQQIHGEIAHLRNKIAGRKKNPVPV